MPRYPVDPGARRWEEAGLVFGLFLILVNWIAVVSGWFAGPVFHPVLIVLGVVIVYACALALGGASRDLTERDY